MKVFIVMSWEYIDFEHKQMTLRGAYASECLANAAKVSLEDDGLRDITIDELEVEGIA
jgi:uncharacterized protein YjaZ